MESKYKRRGQAMTRPPIRHTPGPWFHCRDKDGVDDVYEIVTEDGQCLTTIRFWDEPDSDRGEQAEADACLIANAPELLAELKRVDAYLTSIEATDYNAEKLLFSVRAAISAAER